MEAASHRTFYGDLAPWWPLISPVAGYEEEAAYVATLLESASLGVREVLELGSGGGHNAAHLKTRYAMTLVDLSPRMLEVSRELNPGCEHRVGDMRDVRLGREFDAVFVHDAIDSITTEAELRQAFDTAFAHCRPGGVAVFVPDDTRETYRPGTGQGGSDAADGRGVRYLEWNREPDPDGTTVLTEYAFLLRSADGEVEAVHVTERCGLFPEQRWLSLLRAAGFRARAVSEETTEARPPRRVFVGHRDR